MKQKKGKTREVSLKKANKIIVLGKQTMIEQEAKDKMTNIEQDINQPNKDKDNEHNTPFRQDNRQQLEQPGDGEEMRNSSHNQANLYNNHAFLNKPSLGTHLESIQDADLIKETGGEGAGQETVAGDKAQCSHKSKQENMDPGRQEQEEQPETKTQSLEGRSNKENGTRSKYKGREGWKILGLNKQSSTAFKKQRGAKSKGVEVGAQPSSSGVQKLREQDIRGLLLRTGPRNNREFPGELNMEPRHTERSLDDI